jgi:hypothetical protein
MTTITSTDPATTGPPNPAALDLRGKSGSRAAKNSIATVGDVGLPSPSRSSRSCGSCTTVLSQGRHT